MVDRQFVSGDCFSTLGVRPAVGRLISVADDVRDGGPDGVVAVISYSFWQRQYAGAPQIIGSKILFNRVPVTAIGVTPPHCGREPSCQRRSFSHRTGWAEPAPAKVACRSR